MTERLYGVSSGNGNDGVSHLYPDYYVRTADPYRLAELAIIGQFKPEAYSFVKEFVEVDGEADYTISAMILEPIEKLPEPAVEGEHHEDEDDEDEPEEGGSWADANGAWLIVEVFPLKEGEEPNAGKMVYDSLEDAFTEDLLAVVPAEPS